MADHDTLRLAAYRTRSADWMGLACADATDQAGLWTDAHGSARGRMLIALQYDRHPSDRALVEFLFDHEVARHAREPYGGLHEPLERAAFLLAAYRKPADVQRLWRAKLANYDTYCGLDVNYLVAAGLHDTVAYLQAANHPEHAAILSFIQLYDQARFTPEALAAWWRAVEQRFPPTLAAESPQVRLSRALEAGDVDEARRWLLEWERRESPSHALYRELAAYWEELGDFDRAAALQQHVIASVPDDDYATLARFVALCKLAELLRRAGAFAEAWQTLLDAEQVNAAEAEWTGGRRDLAWQAIRLAADVPPGDPLGPRAFAWACHFIAEGCPTSPALLEEGCTAAARLGNARAAAWLRSLLSQEHARALVE